MTIKARDVNIRLPAMVALLGLVLALPYLAPIDILGVHIGLLQLSLMGVWVIGALGLNIVTGYSGQISLAHNVFIASGAYTAALLMERQGVPFWLAVFAGGGCAAAVGVVVGVPALRIAGFHLAIVTVALAVAMTPILLKFTDFTGGYRGVTIDMPAPPPFLSFLDQDRWLCYLSLFAAVLMTFLAWSMMRSPVGRAWIAIRDSEVGAQAIGINLARYKVLAFVMSAFYGGLAGALYVQVVGGVTPYSFGMMTSLTFLTMIVIGGLATISGSVLAGIAYVLFPEVFRTLQIRFSDVMIGSFSLKVLLQDAQSILYGGMLIFNIILMPEGVAGGPLARLIRRGLDMRLADLTRPFRRLVRGVHDAGP